MMGINKEVSRTLTECRTHNQPPFMSVDAMKLNSRWAYHQSAARDANIEASRVRWTFPIQSSKWKHRFYYHKKQRDVVEANNSCANCGCWPGTHFLVDIGNVRDDPYRPHLPALVCVTCADGENV